MGRPQYALRRHLQDENHNQFNQKNKGTPWCPRNSSFGFSWKAEQKLRCPSCLSRGEDNWTTPVRDREKLSSFYRPLKPLSSIRAVIVLPKSAYRKANVRYHPGHTGNSTFRYEKYETLKSDRAVLPHPKGYVVESMFLAEPVFATASAAQLETKEVEFFGPSDSTTSQGDTGNVQKFWNSSCL